MIPFQDIIHFWLEKGVDGFRVGAVNRLLEAAHLRDEPQVDPKKAPVSPPTPSSDRMYYI